MYVVYKGCMAMFVCKIYEFMYGYVCMCHSVKYYMRILPCVCARASSHTTEIPAAAEAAALAEALGSVAVSISAGIIPACGASAN
jgi:hypothetical protein